MDDVDRTMKRETYEELVSQMRQNMQGAIDGRKKYALEVQTEETPDEAPHGKVGEDVGSAEKEASFPG